MYNQTLFHITVIIGLLSRQSHGVLFIFETYWSFIGHLSQCSGVNTICSLKSRQPPASFKLQL